MKHIYLLLLILFVLPTVSPAAEQKKPLAAPFAFRITAANGQFRLSWQNPDHVRYESIHIYRKIVNSRAERNMQEMAIYTDISGNQQKFTDTAIEEGKLYIYALQGVGKDKEPGKFSNLRTAILPDLIPPAQLAPPQAKVSDKGLVTLRWKAAPEKDVVTYQIYRGLEGVRDLQPVRVIKAQDAQVYQEQLDPKSPFPYLFAIIANDSSGNRSAMSEIIRVTVKDIRPPEKPFLTALQPTAQNIELHWTPSPSPDVAGYNVYRSIDNWKTRKKINEKLVVETQFNDTTTQYNQVYNYYVTAVDLAGNESHDSGSYSCRSLVEMQIFPPENIKLRKTKTGQPNLVWEDMGGNIRGYLVERRPEGQKDFRQVSTLLQDTHFSDDHTMEWKKIEYRLRALYINGKISPPSVIILWQATEKKGGK